MSDQSINSDNAELTARLAKLEANISTLEPSERIDLSAMFAIFWRARWLIAAVTAFFTIASVALALWLPNQYKATAILAPATSSNSSSLASLAGQFGGLASLAGLNISSDTGADRSVVAMELVKTWGFLDDFIRTNGIEVEVFAATRWDRANNRLVIDSDLYDENKKEWVRDFDPRKGETAEPSSWELFQELSDKIGVRQDAVTNLISISVEHYSPHLAKAWVDALVSAINEHLRVRDRDEASRSIDYLTTQVEQTSLTEMHAVFYQLIEEQTKTLMLTEVSDEYALKTLSEAKVPEEKSRPRRDLLVAFGLFGGFVLACLLALARSIVENRRVTESD